MTTDDLIPTILSVGILLSFIVVFVRLAKNPARTADLRYSIFLARRSSLVFAATSLVGAFAVNALLGVVLVAAGHQAGWSLVIVAPGYLVMLACFIHVGRLPFDPSTDPDVDDSPLGNAG